MSLGSPRLTKIIKILFPGRVILFVTRLVRQLSREFLRAGADVIQAFSFYASEDKLVNRGHYAGKKIGVSRTLV